MGIVHYAKMIDLTDKEYYSSYGEYMSVSLLKRFAENPLGFDEYMLNRKENEKPTDALVLGQAVHMAVMEGWDQLKVCYSIIDDDMVTNPRTGKPYGRSTAKFESLCKTVGVNPWRVLTSQDVNDITAIYDACMDHPEAYQAINDCTHVEWSLRGELNGVKFQGKMDGANCYGRIVDLKTMRADSTPFEQIVSYRYLWQAWCYIQLYADANNMEPANVDFDFIFATKEAEPKVTVVGVREHYGQALDRAGEQVLNALTALKVSEAQGDRRAALMFLEE